MKNDTASDFFSSDLANEVLFLLCRVDPGDPSNLGLLA